MQIQAERVREWFRTSLAFAPVVATLVAFATAKLTTRIDQSINQQKRAWWLFDGTAESAGQFLTSVTSSLMQLTAVVFSITILVLQLAASQFSPRVLRTFLEDRQTQRTIGVFIGSFVYSTTLLLDLRSATPQQQEFVPALSVFLTFLLVLLSVLMFANYIHNMAHAIRAVNVIYRVADETRESIADLYPEGLLHDQPTEMQHPQGTPTESFLHDRPPGVVMRVEDRKLMRLACQHDVVIELVPQVGDFVPRGAAMFRIWGASSLTNHQLRANVVIGYERTPYQDPAFGFRQLVDVAERALSPAVNDPTTAVQAIDQIHDLLRTLARKSFPTATRVDKSGRLRLILPHPSWETFVHLAVDEIRQYGSSSIQVVRRLRGMLEDLLACTPPDRQPVLRQQLRMVQASVQKEFAGLDRLIASAGNSDGNG